MSSVPAVVGGEAPPRQILFVDDDESVLEGLRRVLRADRRRWQMRFAASGADALELLSAQPADVVVSDLRMPVMDGVQLLRKVREAWPRTARVVLSGYADLGAAARASSVAHQYLSKPCDPEALRAVVDRACELQDLLHSDALRKVVGAAGSIPAAPRVHEALTRALEDPRTEPRHLVPIVESDPGIAARLLQFVNSAYFGLAKKVTSIEGAILYLGISTVKHLALSVELSQAYGLPTEVLAPFERHARLTAGLAKKRAGAGQGETAYAAGLLHGAGRLVLMSRMPEDYALAAEETARTGRPRDEVEKELIGATAASVGAYLLGLWGLPPAIVEAVAFHDEPGRVCGAGDAVSAVGVGCLLAKVAEPGREPTTEIARAEASLAALLGADAAAWRETAAADARQLAQG
jgi:HD-like signal output (HDOD) protein